MHYGITSATDPAQEQAKRDKAFQSKASAARAEYEKNRVDNTEQINEKHGVSNDYDEIVAQANAKGVESLTDYQKMIYNSLARDENGNIKKSKNGQYELDQSKQGDVAKYLSNPENMKNMSPEDLVKARNQAAAVQEMMADSTANESANIAVSALYGEDSR